MEEAMEVFYLSDTFRKLADTETGLYLEGSAYIYEMLQRELAEGCFLNGRTGPRQRANGR